MSGVAELGRDGGKLSVGASGLPLESVGVEDLADYERPLRRAGPALLIRGYSGTDDIYTALTRAAAQVARLRLAATLRSVASTYGLS